MLNGYAQTKTIRLKGTNQSYPRYIQELRGGVHNNDTVAELYKTNAFLRERKSYNRKSQTDYRGTSFDYQLVNEYNFKCKERHQNHTHAATSIQKSTIFGNIFITRQVHTLGVKVLAIRWTPYLVHKENFGIPLKCAT